MSGLHPRLREMVEHDAMSSRFSVSWIINDAIAAYYRSPEFSSAYLDALRKNGRGK